MIRIGQCGGGVEDDTNDIRRIRRQKRRVKLNHQIPRPSRNCQPQRCAQAPSMPEAAENRHRGRRAAPRHWRRRAQRQNQTRDGRRLKPPRRRHTRHENVRESRVRFRLECRANRVRNRPAFSCADSQWRARRERPSWNAPGVNLRGQVGGRSRLAHGTIRRLGRQRAPPPAVRRRCAYALQGSGPQKVIARPIAFSLAIVRCCRCSILLC